MNISTNRAWYDKKRFVLPLLFIFPPVGIYALWKGSIFQQTARIILSIISAGWFLLAIFSDKKITSSPDQQATVPAHIQNTAQDTSSGTDASHSLSSPGNTAAENLHKFKINIVNSDLYFEIQVEKVELLKKKNYFSVTQEKYAKPVQEDGFVPKITFSIKNPYPKEYIVPIPDDFDLFGENEEAFKNLPDAYHHGKVYNKMRSNYFYSGELTARNSKAINFEYVNREKRLSFKPGESKTFELTFPPLTADIQKVILEGFYIKKEYNPYRGEKLNFIIDLAQQKVVNRETQVETR